MTDFSIGIIMREAVRRAIQCIESQRFTFTHEHKRGYNGSFDDVVTSADKDAQRLYVDIVRNAFPGFGIVAEENGLAIPCDFKRDKMYFTIDAMDGTKAFLHYQSQAIGTMIALVRGKQVIASYIGDVLTGEIYGFYPNASHVMRIDREGREMPIETPSQISIRQGHVLLRCHPDQHSAIVQRVARLASDGGLCRGIQITNGSVGLSTARLWKGEVGMVVIRMSHVTPWDMAPIIGISKRLGCLFLRPNRAGTRLIQAHLVPVNTVQEQTSELVIVHQSRWDELKRWQEEKV